MRWFFMGLAAAATLGAITQTAAAADPKPTIEGGDGCGSVDNAYFCMNFTTADDQARKTISEFEVRHPAPGRALVTWSGTVDCSVTPTTPDGKRRMASGHEYYVYLALKNDNSPYVLRGPGTATLGERFRFDILGVNGNAKINDYDLTAERIDIKPVTLTRLFNVTRSGKTTYKAIGFADFRSVESGAFCNVNGGWISVSYVPN